MFEISQKDKTDLRTLVISCDGVKEGIAAVNDLISKAPSIEGWSIVAFRQPVDDNLTIEMDGLKLSTSDILFDYQAAQDNMIDITLYVDKLSDTNRDKYLQATFVLLDAAIGEYAAMTKIRYIDLLQTPKDTKVLHSLNELIKIIK